MGTTLQNGVYLPNEGERNCYAGLKTNWEILDQKVADVTALQQAVAGALHRQIVTQLPTEDIDPNTIYMILSGTSATENVYNEYMYVNNAWELIGTSATDLTNYYTKSEVDGKLLLKANASDLTSHTGDTTIHVTTADKTKWNNGVSQSYVLRYSSSSVTDNSTIAYSTIDNTDNIKSGDKVIDVDGKIFSIVSVDTANQTVTVGSALIDLALDANVVHTSGNETVTGTKTFDNVNLPFKNTSEFGVSGGSTNITFSDKNGQQLCALKTITYSTGVPSFLLTLTQKVDNTIYTTNGISVYQQANSKVIQLRPILPNNNADGLSVWLGSSLNTFSRIYGLAYYYGNDNVEFSTKFVTTDTAQTVSGNKTFSSDLSIFNTNTTANTPNLNLRNYKADRETTDAAVQSIQFLDKNGKALTSIESRKISNGNSATNILCYNTDDSNNTVLGGIAIIKGKNDTSFAPNTDNAVNCGRALAKWSDVQTYKVNGVEPSSLGMPEFSKRVDIAGYISNLTGATNNYTPSVNGWLYVGSNDASYLALFDTGSGGCGIRFSDGVVGEKYACIPCQAGRTLGVRITCTNLAHAYFIPCQGNV